MSNNDAPEYLASSEGGTSGRDAANLESTYYVDLDDTMPPTKEQELKVDPKIDNIYDMTDQDYADNGGKDKLPEKKLAEIHLYGAKHFSKKIKEELGKKRDVI